MWITLFIFNVIPSIILHNSLVQSVIATADQVLVKLVQ